MRQILKKIYWVGAIILAIFVGGLFHLDIIVLNTGHAMYQYANSDIFFEGTLPRNDRAIGTTLCELRRGMMLFLPDYINGERSDYHQCIFPFSDAGDICYSSSQCKDDCIVSEDTIAGHIDATLEPSWRSVTEDTIMLNSPVTGTCSNVPLKKKNCVRYWRLLEGSMSVEPVRSNCFN